ncbi:hypothetical protein ANO14919_134140 [Xylariales sp. No.14919]|nr:hypothetical protein ANO14919_134140 [Xylariales sp. No.14919]
MGDIGSGPNDQHVESIVVAVIALSITLGAVSARTYTKAAVMRNFDLTDWILLVAAALVVVFVSLEIHIWDTNTPSLGEVLLSSNVLEIIYCPAIFCAKYVVLRQIELVFLNHHRKAFAFIAIRILIWANLLFYASSFVSFLLSCIPRAKISDPSLPGVCIDTQLNTILSGAINVISDLTILFTPIVVIWRLQMPVDRKFKAAVVFGVGGLANIASIFRLYYSIQLALTQSFLSAIGVGNWAVGEFTTVILVACFPYFPRLYQHLSRKRQTPGVSIPNGLLRTTPVTRPPGAELESRDDSLATFGVLGDSESGVPVDGARPSSL